MEEEEDYLTEEDYEEDYQPIRIDKFGVKHYANGFVEIPPINKYATSKELMQQVLIHVPEDDVHFIKILFIGSPGSGKTVCCTFLSEEIGNYFGWENVKVLTYDKDFRMKPEYLCKNLGNKTEARLEIIEELQNCDKPVFIFQGSDLGYLFGQKIYTDRQAWLEVENFIEDYLMARHQNPKIKYCYFNVGVQSPKMISKDIRRTFPLVILKDAPFWMRGDIQEICSLSKRQRGWLKMFDRQVNMEHIKPLSIVLFSDQPRELYFEEPNYLIDWKAKKTKRIKIENEEKEEDNHFESKLPPDKFDMISRRSRGALLKDLIVDYGVDRKNFDYWEMEALKEWVKTYKPKSKEEKDIENVVVKAAN